MMMKIRKQEEIRDGVTMILVRNSYDEFGRRMRQVDSDGNLNIWEYLPNNSIRQIMNGQVVKESRFNDEGRLEYTKRITGGVIREEQWIRASQNETRLVSENGQQKSIITIVYDDLGRLIRRSQTNPDVSKIIEYTSTGRKQLLLRGKDVWKTMLYDKNGKLQESLSRTGETRNYYYKENEILIIISKEDGAKSFADVFRDKIRVSRITTKEKIDEKLRFFREGK
jgi:hypothetical protein